MDIKRLPDGTSRGFAFVKFSDTEAVEKVIDAHAKHMIDNKWVEVKRHDGVAASAGLTSSMTKDEPEHLVSLRKLCSILSSIFFVFSEFSLSSHVFLLCFLCFQGGC